MFDRTTLHRFRKQLCRWFVGHGRNLPWTGADPYRVWISEIMLQQTTVVAVIPYYERFLRRFPTVQRLAEAEEAEVLQLWEGLGYYSRGRNLLRAARAIVTNHNGELPHSVPELTALPGIGRYTAGAIASFGQGQPVPIVEANTQRLYCRLLGTSESPQTSSGQRLLWEFATQLVPQQDPGQFNQALMDLGATVCTPKQPRCEQCPVRSCCRAFALGKQQEIPPPKVRPEVTDVTELCVAISHKKQWLLRRRPTTERWAGLWDFPRIPLSPELTSPTRLEECVSTALHAWGLSVAEIRMSLDFRHQVTRYRIHLHCFTAALNTQRRKPNLRALGETQWSTADGFQDLPFSTPARKFAAHLGTAKK